MNNDRFKFRVWDNKNKLYDNDGFLLDGRNGMLVAVGDFTIEQCTGLKDKNGTLIYEGDIVRFVQDNGNVIDGYYVVKFDEMMCHWVTVPVSDNDFSQWRFTQKIARDNYEVVGNIHEVQW